MPEPGKKVFNEVIHRFVSFKIDFEFVSYLLHLINKNMHGNPTHTNQKKEATVRYMLQVEPVMHYNPIGMQTKYIQVKK